MALVRIFYFQTILVAVFLECGNSATIRTDIKNRDFLNYNREICSFSCTLVEGTRYVLRYHGIKLFLMRGLGFTTYIKFSAHNGFV